MSDNLLTLEQAREELATTTLMLKRHDEAGKLVQVQAATRKESVALRTAIAALEENAKLREALRGEWISEISGHPSEERYCRNCGGGKEIGSPERHSADCLAALPKEAKRPCASSE